jgi:hypothetical protein
VNDPGPQTQNPDSSRPSLAVRLQPDTLAAVDRAREAYTPDGHVARLETLLALVERDVGAAQVETERERERIAARVAGGPFCGRCGWPVSRHPHAFCLTTDNFCPTGTPGPCSSHGHGRVDL